MANVTHTFATATTGGLGPFTARLCIGTGSDCKWFDLPGSYATEEEAEIHSRAVVAAILRGTLQTLNNQKAREVVASYNDKE